MNLRKPFTFDNTAGTHTLDELLINERQPIYDYGIDETFELINNDLQAHNATLRDSITYLADPTIERLKRTGLQVQGAMMKASEYSRGITHRNQGGADSGFPLEKFLFPVGWTLDFLKAATVGDLARMTIAAQKADIQALAREIKRAIYLPTNYTFADEQLEPGQSALDLAVKRLLNADGYPIPTSPDGVEFDNSTHTHYSAFDWAGGNETTRTAAVDALVENILEHYQGAEVEIIIRSTQVSDFSALSAFTAVQPTFVIPTGSTDGTVDVNDPSRNDNKIVGYWRGNHRIRTKPWAIASYPIAINVRSGTKPLAYRERATTSLRGLRLASQFENAPLQADTFEHEFGFGVDDRMCMAVLYTGGGSYTAPTIT